MRGYRAILEKFESLVNDGQRVLGNSDYWKKRGKVLGLFGAGYFMPTGGYFVSLARQENEITKDDDWKGNLEKVAEVIALRGYCQYLGLISKYKIIKWT